MLEKEFYLSLAVHCAIFLLMPWQSGAQNSRQWAQKAASLMVGAIDMHVHSAPDNVSRSLNDHEVMLEAKNKKMRAVVIKSHIAPTTARAALQNLQKSEVICYGGIALNRQVGGLNPTAVQAMIDMDPQFGKIVWMPTRDAAFARDDGVGLTIFSGHRVLPEVSEILDLILAHDLVLATGHLAPHEIKKLVHVAAEKGIDKIIITHGLAEKPGLSRAEIKELSALGAKTELTYLNSVLDRQNAKIRAATLPLSTTISLIHEIGADHFIISSDLGQAGNPRPAQGLQSFIDVLLKGGISEAEIKTMVQKNPAFLLNIE